ncbi:MAG: hypothetical protein GWN18_01035 [Thermoplasmata archaeon]|nr:hypothetical protein [Thermoplasmata archaeon]NIS10584.1 hypothetical protein [Thermoplasmata archaeon]NIS18546.1 hypothetical protein [Thermoplasmata archaeon]NIT75532.1 hypothetical protein [Thermoplasmata archaeon]NIU47699.1 hypothetical protein [Thermoplasmata archaeon]
MAEAYGLLRPTSVCISLSDRELWEVRQALRADGEEDPAVDEDYVPESEGMRRMLGVGPVEPEGEDGDDEGDEDDDSDEGYDDDVPDELEMPAGVVSREQVERAMDEPFHPDLVAADAAAAGDQVFISDTDMAYSRKLATFGDVELPPPAFMEAVRAADRDKVPVSPIDLTDDEYTLVFVDNVTYWQLVKHTRRVKSMRRYKARSPTDMAEEWDRRIRSIKGFAVLEKERERKMAMEVADRLRKHDRVLAVIDVMRVPGMLEHLAKEMAA